MAFNIVSTIISMLAPAVIDRLAAALGVNASVARTALAAAVPSVLGALGSKAATDTGARALFDAVSKTDTSALGDLAGSLTGAAGEKFVQGGLGSLTSLLGDSTLKGLTGAIAKQAGIGGDASSSIVGLASSLAMGQLSKSVASDGLNASSLAGLLKSQQSNITAALPAGLGSMLSSAGVLGSDFAGTAARTASAATAQAMNTANAAKKTGSNWLMWLIPLLAVLAALWYFLGHKTETAMTDAAKTATTAATTAADTATNAATTAANTATTAATTAATAVTDAAKSLMVDGVDLNAQVTQAFDGLKTTLGSITDAASAQAALPKLEDAVKSVDGLTATLTKLSPDQRTMLAGVINAGLPTLKDLIAKVLAIPGVGDIVKPTADALLAKVTALANPA